MKRIMLTVLLSSWISVCCMASIDAQTISVSYDCSELPGPWNITGNGNILGPGDYHHLLEIDNGILRMNDPDINQWIWLKYINPAIGQTIDFHIAVRAKIISNNGAIASPTITLGNFDSARPFYNRLNFLFTIDLYPDRLEFSRVENETSYNSTLLGSHSIQDFNTNFHEIILYMNQSLDRNFIVYVDSVPVITITGESIENPLNCVAVGHGRAVGIGASEWDYINFQTSTPVAVDQSSWGNIKEQFKK